MSTHRFNRPSSVVLFAGFVSLLAGLTSLLRRNLRSDRLPALPAVPAKRRLTAWVGALLLSAWPAFAQFNPDTLQTVLDASRDQTSASGAAAAIVRNGVVLWQGQSGVIAPGSAVPVNPNTLFIYGSASKMVTAAMTMRLVEQDKLGLNDTIDNYLPAFVPGASGVTVRQLLQQTSSYPDIYRSNNAADVIARLQQVNNPVTRTELMSFIEAPAGIPGVQHAYSNTNYILLGEVIERASGKTFEQVYQEVIATPLGLNRDFRAFVTPQPREAFAQSVDTQFGGEINYFNNTTFSTDLPATLYGPAFGDGPVAGTAVEGALFLDALARGNLLGTEALAEMLTFDPVSGYGFGIYGSRIDGKLLLDHSGEWAGYTSNLFYDENLNLTIMTLANSNLANSGGMLPAVVIAADLGGAVSAIPEPSTYTALAAAAALAFAVGVRRRNVGQRSGRSS